MSSTTQREINYKVNVEPTLLALFRKMASDIGTLGISQDDLVRAMWVFADEQINQMSESPQWLWDEVDRRRQQADTLNTVEGEVGG